MTMMMMKRNPIILVTCILLLSSLAALAQDSFGPDDCCYTFYSRRLQKDRVQSYKFTDSQCAKEAVVFTMKSGAEFCVKPTEPWVQKIIEAKQKAQA